MAKKTVVSDTTTTVYDALAQARNVIFNGHKLSVEMLGEHTLHFRPEGFDDKVEKPFNFNDPGLCNGLVTSWLSFSNGQYKVALPGLHLYRTWEELVATPGGFAQHVGFGRGKSIMSLLPKEWLARILELPRQDDGVFRFEYAAGKLKIEREMKDSSWTEGEYDGFDGPKHQRDAFYKHVALDMHLQGMAINAHFYNRAEKWLDIVTPSFDAPIAERIEQQNKNTAASIVRNTERNVHAYYEQQNAAGTPHVSGLPTIVLMDGTALTQEQAMEKEILRWKGNIYLGMKRLTAMNINEFFTICSRIQLKLALNDGQFNPETGKAVA